MTEEKKTNENAEDLLIMSDFDRHKLQNFHLLQKQGEKMIFVTSLGNFVKLYHFTKEKRFKVETTQMTFRNGIGAITAHSKLNVFAVAGRCFEKEDHPAIKIYTDLAALDENRVLENGTENCFTAVKFSPSGDKLAALGDQPDYSISIWDWQSETLIRKCRAIGQSMFVVRFNKDESQLATGGVGHLKFWSLQNTFTGLKLQGEIGKFGKVEACDIECFAFFEDGKILTGTQSGSLVIWEGVYVKLEVRCNQDQTDSSMPHSGAVRVVESTDTKFFTSSTMESMIKVWSKQNLNDAELSEGEHFFILQPSQIISFDNSLGHVLNLIVLKNEKLHLVFTTSEGHVSEHLDSSQSLIGLPKLKNVSAILFDNHGLYIAERDMITFYKNGDFHQAKYQISLGSEHRSCTCLVRTTKSNEKVIFAGLNDGTMLTMFSPALLDLNEFKFITKAVTAVNFAEHQSLVFMMHSNDLCIVRSENYKAFFPLIYFEQNILAVTICDQQVLIASTVTSSNTNVFVKTIMFSEINELTTKISEDSFKCDLGKNEEDVSFTVEGEEILNIQLVLKSAKLALLTTKKVAYSVDIDFTGATLNLIQTLPHHESFSCTVMSDIFMYSLTNQGSIYIFKSERRKILLLEKLCLLHSNPKVIMPISRKASAGSLFACISHQGDMVIYDHQHFQHPGSKTFIENREPHHAEEKSTISVELTESVIGAEERKLTRHQEECLKQAHVYKKRTLEDVEALRKHLRINQDELNEPKEILQFRETKKKEIMLKANMKHEHRLEKAKRNLDKVLAGLFYSKKVDLTDPTGETKYEFVGKSCTFDEFREDSHSVTDDHPKHEKAFEIESDVRKLRGHHLRIHQRKTRKEKLVSLRQELKKAKDSNFTNELKPNKMTAKMQTTVNESSNVKLKLVKKTEKTINDIEKSMNKCLDMPYQFHELYFHSLKRLQLLKEGSILRTFSKTENKLALHNNNIVKDVKTFHGLLNNQQSMMKNFNDKVTCLEEHLLSLDADFKDVLVDLKDRVKQKLKECFSFIDENDIKKFGEAKDESSGEESDNVEQGTATRMKKPRGCNEKTFHAFLTLRKKKARALHQLHALKKLMMDLQTEQVDIDAKLKMKLDELNQEKIKQLNLFESKSKKINDVISFALVPISGIVLGNALEEQSIRDFTNGTYVHEPKFARNLLVMSKKQWVEMKMASLILRDRISLLSSKMKKEKKQLKKLQQNKSNLQKEINDLTRELEDLQVSKLGAKINLSVIDERLCKVESEQSTRAQAVDEIKRESERKKHILQREIKEIKLKLKNALMENTSLINENVRVKRETLKCERIIDKHFELVESKSGSYFKSQDGTFDLVKQIQANNATIIDLQKRLDGSSDNSLMVNT